MSSLNTENKVARIFPKLFIGDASKAFIKYLKKSNLNYDVNYISSREELIDFINLYSGYKQFNQPIIISDISFFNKRDQSLLLKFMDDTNLKLILLASRDNILDTIVSRVKEFRKYYVSSASNFHYYKLSNARDKLDDELNANDDLSYEDKLIMCNKYNPIIGYNDKLVESYNSNDRNKLLNLLEYTNE